VRFLLFSDLHLDTAFKWAGPDVAASRRRALRETLQRICQVALDENVDALLCAGDLYENDMFSANTAEFLRLTIAEVGRPVYLAPGNHDWFGPKSLYGQVAWSSNVHLFQTPQLVPVEITSGLTLWGAAHARSAGTPGFLDSFSVDRGGINLALFHGSENAELAGQESGKAPHAPFNAAQIPQTGLQHAFVGHYHAPKDGEWHTYPGNPDPLSFGETGERGAVLIDVGDDGSITRRRIDVHRSEVHDVEVDLTGISHTDQVRERVAQATAQLHGVVRVTLFGEPAQDVDIRLRDLAGAAAHLEGLVPRLGSIATAYDLEAISQEQTVRGRFVAEVQAAALEPDIERRVLLTGLRAFDGRIDELEVS